MIVTKEEAIQIISLVAIADNEHLADLEHYQLVEKLNQHFGLPDENCLVPKIAVILERRKQFHQQFGLAPK